MSPVRTISYSSWVEFKRDLFFELYPRGRFRRGQYLFRGAGDADWKLSTTFDRQFAGVPLEPQMRLWDELIAE
jgi:hypothetical protein